MTLTEIDQSLQDWETKITAATENLLALEDLPVIRRLRLAKPPGLTGKTAAKVQPALALLPQLFQDISLLTNVIDRATELRRPLTAFWRPERTLDQIESLLNGPSVALPALQTPFSQRGLLSASEQAQAITLSALLGAMSQTFDEVKATLLETEDAWAKCEASLRAARDKVAVLEQMAAALGETNARDLLEIRTRLERWATEIATDPLGHPADTGWDGNDLLRQTRERLESAAVARDKANPLRDEANVLVTEWVEVQRNASVVRAECAAKIAAPPPGVSDRLPEMRLWLATLEDTYAQRRWPAAAIGLEHWLKTARACLEEEKRAASTCAAWLESLEELPGRLAALRAKAKARNLATHPDLIRAGREADAILRLKPPVPLARAETAVVAYADMLNALLKERI